MQARQKNLKNFYATCIYELQTILGNLIMSESVNFYGEPNCFVLNEFVNIGPTPWSDKHLHDAYGPLDGIEYFFTAGLIGVGVRMR